jgi:hypothetical protein
MFLPLPNELIIYIGKFFTISERLGYHKSFEKKLEKLIKLPRHENGNVSTLISYYNKTRYLNQINGFRFHKGFESNYFCITKNGFTYELNIFEINDYEDCIIYECDLTVSAWTETDRFILYSLDLLEYFDINTDMDLLGISQTDNNIKFSWAKYVIYGYNNDIKFGKSQILYMISKISLNLSKHIYKHLII